MTTPAFIVDLRKKIGTDPLWLSGITAYVEDDAGRILLGKRADTGDWALVSGIIEPGEEPAVCAVREVKEETGIDVEPTALVSAETYPRLITYGNGDQCRFLDLLFMCSARLGGASEPHVADDESTSVGWFAPDELPEPLSSSTRERLATVARWRERAETGDARTFFKR